MDVDKWLEDQAKVAEKRDLISDQFVVHGARMDRVAICTHCDHGGPVTPEPTEKGVRIVCNFCWIKTPAHKHIDNAINSWNKLQFYAAQKPS